MEMLDKLLKKRHSIYYRKNASSSVLQELLETCKDKPVSNQNEESQKLCEGLKDGLEELNSNIKFLDEIQEKVEALTPDKDSDKELKKWMNSTGK